VPFKKYFLIGQSNLRFYIKNDFSLTFYFSKNLKKYKLSISFLFWWILGTNFRAGSFFGCGEERKVEFKIDFEKIAFGIKPKNNKT
jgi:hypothetical protein